MGQKKILIKCIFNILFLCFTLSKVYSFELQSYEKKLKTNYQVQSVVEKLSRKKIEENLRKFVASGRPNRVVRSSGHEKSLQYLEETLKKFQSNGVVVKKDEFPLNLYPIERAFDAQSKKIWDELKAAKGINVTWEKKGLIKPEESIILTAHYDTLLRDLKTQKYSLKGEMPGADSNASGVAVLLSLIEILDQLDLSKTVKIIFFDAEEIGSLGSKFFAENFREQKAVGLINITMVGHDTKKDDKEGKLNNMILYYRDKSQEFAKAFAQTGNRNTSNVKFDILESRDLDGAFPRTLENLSQIGIPSILVTENREGDLNPRYLSSNDFPETLNISTYVNVFRFVARSVIAWNFDVPN